MNGFQGVKKPNPGGKTGGGGGEKKHNIDHQYGDSAAHKSVGATTGTRRTRGQGGAQRAGN